MVIETNKNGLPPMETYTVNYNHTTKRFDLRYYAPHGEVRLVGYQSYIAAERGLKDWILDWNVAEAMVEDNDIQSDESSNADSIPPELQDLSQDMDATQLQEEWNDWMEELGDNDPEDSGEPDVPYETIREPYDPIRYE